MSDLRTRAEAEALLIAQRPWLFRLALAILGTHDAAEDAAQEALFRAARSHAKLGPGAQATVHKLLQVPYAVER